MEKKFKVAYISFKLVENRIKGLQEKCAKASVLEYHSLTKRQYSISKNII